MDGMGEPRRYAIMLLSCFAIALSAALTVMEAQIQDSAEPPLRTSEPIDDVIADLRTFIPGQMEAERVPGLSIALIRDGEIVWEEGYGVAHSVRRSPVGPETIFAVASISKVVTAYTALRLVEEGVISLDEPVSTRTKSPWLPPSPWADQISVRQLAAHSSGLSDRMLPINKEIMVEPGTSFLYSGVGFIYLQKIIEEITGEPLEAIASRLTFQPLGMHSSSFLNRGPVRSRMANGHVGYQLPLLVFLVPLAGVLLLMSAIAVILSRVARKGWTFTARDMAAVLVFALVITTLLLWNLIGHALPHLVFLAFACGLGYLAGLLLIWGLCRRFYSRGRRPMRRMALTSITVLLFSLAVLSLAGQVQGPMPNWAAPAPSAVGSLNATAGDLGRLLMELARPQHLGADLAVQLRSPQVEIGGHFSWGLGIGIQHTDQGDALWQNGNMPGYQSVMLMYPDQGLGVVVLTNSSAGQAVAYEVAHRALGGAGHWKSF